MRVRIPIFVILEIKFLTEVVLEIVQNAIFPCTFLMGSFSVKNSKRRTVRSQLLLNQLPRSFFLMRVRIPILAILKIKFLPGIVSEIFQNAILENFSVKNSKRRTVRPQLLLNQLPRSFFLNTC